MGIILATTTITVMGTRPQIEVDPEAEGYDPPPAPPTILATGVRACITRPKSDRRVSNTDEVDDYALKCDIFEAGLTRFDTVIDDNTGVEYAVRVAAVSPATLLGLQHIAGTLRVREGLTSSAPDAT